MLEYKRMQFGNTISSDEAHSNEYAKATVSNQSFTERKEIENNRKVVRAYQHSQIIGQNFTPHGEYVRQKPRVSHGEKRKFTRQEMNANGGIVPERPATQVGSRQAINVRSRSSFHEPSARGYNPYA